MSKQIVRDASLLFKQNFCLSVCLLKDFLLIWTELLSLYQFALKIEQDQVYVNVYVYFKGRFCK